MYPDELGELLALLRPFRYVLAVLAAWLALALLVAVLG